MCEIKFIIYVFMIFLPMFSKQLETDRPETHVSPPNMTNLKKRLIIDTDAGADDAVAILNILAAEDLFGDVKIELITAVSGNTNVDNVARNVLKVLKTADRLDIPLYKGANQSLLRTPKIDNFFGEDGFGDFAFEDSPSEDLVSSEHAVNALIEATSLHPEQLTLVCFGPLTNVALALKLDSRFLKNLKDVYILGGSVNGIGNVKPGVEFNFYVDPEAALIVLEEAEKNKKILHVLPWETAFLRSEIEMALAKKRHNYCSPLKLTKFEVEEKKWRKEILGVIESPQVNLINKAERLTLSEDRWISSDAILSSLVIDDSIVEAADVHHADIEVCGQHGRAALFVDYDGSTNQTKNIRIIRSINVNRFKEMLLQNFNPRGGRTNAASRTC